jgi:hypothetical protein
MAITHGFAGFTQIGSAKALCREGASFLMPRNLDIPYPISVQSFGQLNWGEMPTFPVVQLPLIPMDPLGGTGEWFTAANLNSWFLTRSAAPDYDLTAPTGGIIFSDNGINNAAGVGTFKINNAKAAGFSLNIDKGAPIGFTTRWAGTSRTVTGITPPTAGLDGSPLQAGKVSLGGPLANVGIIGITLDFDTGLSANMEIDGTNGVKEQNADLPTATLTIRQNAQAGIDAPGFDLGGAHTEVTGATIVIVRKPTPVTLTFTINRMIIIDPDNRRQMRGRVIRTFRYNCIASVTAFPITIAEV